jgi:hypothetical protein
MFHNFGTAHAARKEWQAAITNFTKEIQFAPSNHMAYHFLAPLLLQVGDIEGYQGLRAAIIRQFAETSDPIVAERMAKDCLLMPPATADMAVIQKMADTTMVAGPDHPMWLYFQLAKGLSEYRQEHLDSAAERLQKVASEPTGTAAQVYRRAEACLVLAMARHQLHQFWPTRCALSEGCWIASNFLPAPDSAVIGEDANDWLYVQALMREAQGLIETGPNNEKVAKAFEALVGRYDYRSVVNTVTREGSHLFSQVTGQSKFEIFPRSETEFFWMIVDAQVTFVKDDTGKVVKAIHHQNQASIDAPRMEDIVVAKVNPASYNALEGKYDFGQGQTLTVTGEGDQLFAQLMGGPKLEILPKSELEFFWKEINARMTFVKDEKGKVTYAIFHQAGQTLEGPKIQ